MPAELIDFFWSTFLIQNDLKIILSNIVPLAQSKSQQKKHPVIAGLVSRKRKYPALRKLTESVFKPSAGIFQCQLLTESVFKTRNPIPPHWLVYLCI